MSYKKSFKIQVAREASQPEYEGLEHVIAEKYKMRVSTVLRWKEAYQEFGENGLGRSDRKNYKKRSAREIELEKENAELKEEIAILKKAAAFLADLRRE